MALWDWAAYKACACSPASNKGRVAGFLQTNKSLKCDAKPAIKWCPSKPFAKISL